MRRGFREIRTRENVERNLSFDPDKRVIPGQTQNVDPDERFDPDKRLVFPDDIETLAERELREACASIPADI